MTLSLITPAASLPATLSDLKTYLRMDSSYTTEDAELTQLITFATSFVQRETQQQITPATFCQFHDRFPSHAWGYDFYGWPNLDGLGFAGPVYPFVDGTQRHRAWNTIRLEQIPAQSVTNVKYITGATLTTLSPSLYTVDVVGKPGRIVLVQGNDWPATDCVPNAVQITFVAGYATPDAMWQQAIFWLCGHCYENREATTSLSINKLPFALQAVIESLMFRNSYAA